MRTRPLMSVRLSTAPTQDIGADDPRSYHAFMYRHLFAHVNLSRKRIHFLDGATRDADAECIRFERTKR